MKGKTYSHPSETKICFKIVGFVFPVFLSLASFTFEFETMRHSSDFNSILYRKEKSHDALEQGDWFDAAPRSTQDVSL